jgi:glutamate dehydrogenase (NAD(P)+)
VAITAIADEFGCVTDAAGLDVPHMLATPYCSPVPLIARNAARLPGEALFTRPADMILLAAGQEAISPARAAGLAVPLVVVGANCGLSGDAERVLLEAGVFVVPDFVGGVGGSASMEALFGPPRPPSPRQVLDGLTEMMSQIVAHLVDTATRRSMSLRAAAEALAQEGRVAPASPPYGCSPYLSSRVAGALR